jgi:hypothetical protein
MRLNIDLPDERVDDVKSLMKTIGADTYKELLNNALTLLEWSVGEVSTGRAIASVDVAGNEYRILAMPILDNARKTAQRRVAKLEPVFSH